MSGFVPPRWLRGAHAQTVVASFVVRGRPPFARERWDTPDGDFLDVDVIEPRRTSAPVVALLHGRGGSTQSGYVRRQAEEFVARGAGVVAVNSRGASGVPNRRPRLYHAGETDDPAFVVRAMASRWRGRPLALIGFSLGGSRTLHLVGRRAEGRLLARAVAVSAPLDLARCVDVLDGARPPLYTRYLLRGLKRQLRLRRDLAALVDVERALAAPSIRAFDDALIAPLHGFASAEDYYARCSAGPVLPDVAVPTLAIRAEDDPFLAREDLAHFDAASAQVEIVRTPRGGHVGFLDARLRPWSLMRAAEWVVGGAGAG